METNLPSLIFIDGGNPAETKQAKEILGHIDGQTTNPSLVAKNPEIMRFLVDGKKLTQTEAISEYKKIVEKVSKVTKGPVSIQVIADANTKKDEMLRQARVYRDWIPNGVVKFPCIPAGLAAAEEFCQEWSINITLNFSQEQAAAVYVATKKAKHRVFISPFVGRLDDRGENGMEVVANILKMYQKTASSVQHLASSEERSVEVLTASVRKLDHLFYALFLKSDAITVPFNIFQKWADTDFKQPLPSYRYDPGELMPIPYKELSLDRDWRDYNLQHDLTDAGVEKFMEDWNSITK